MSGESAIDRLRGMRCRLQLSGIPLTIFDIKGVPYTRHERIAQYVGDWHPSQHPGLVALLDRLTHQLAASGEAPGRDLDPVSAGSAAPEPD